MSGNMIVTVPNEIGPIEESTLLSSKEYSLDSFTIHLNIKKIDDESNQVLIYDERNQVYVQIVDKKVKFTVKSVSVTSKNQIQLNENVNITCVRERNTMLKIYINGELSQSNYIDGQEGTISLKFIQVSKSSVVYNSIIISSYGFSYKDALESNEKVIRLKTALADATSEKDDHKAMYAIDDNEVTYWLSEEGEDQSIKISLDREVFIEKIGYVAHDDSSSIKDYTISVSLDNVDWHDITGSWSNKNGQKDANVNQKLKYLILKGNTDSGAISASQIYFYGSEIENEDHNPTQPPPPSPLPTKTNTPEPTTSPDDDKKKERLFLIVGIAVGIVAIIVIVTLIACLVRRRKKSQNDLNAEPLITVNDK